MNSNLFQSQQKNRKAQVWSLDLMAGLTLFLVGIVVFSIYSANQPAQSREALGLLSNDGNIIANNLLSQGYPKNWNISDVVTPGLLSNNSLNQTKLQNLYQIDLTQNGYAKTKNLFDTGYDYYFFLDKNMTIDSISVEGIGKPNATKNNINAKNLIKITRFVIYQNKTTPFYLYVWNE